MDKKTIIGFVLIAAVLIGFSYYNQPSQEELAYKQMQDSVALLQQQKAALEEVKKAQQEANEKLAVQTDTTHLFHKATTGKNQVITLSNSVAKVDIDTKGGAVSRVILKEYTDQQKAPITLFDRNDADLAFSLPTRIGEEFTTTDYYFTPIQVTDSTVTMRLEAGNGGFLDLKYELLSNNYMVNFTISSQGLENFVAPRCKEIVFEWSEAVRQQEKGYKFENQYSTLTYKKKNGGTDYLNAANASTENIAESLDWIAFKNQFFSCVFIAHQDINQAELSSEPLVEGSGYLKDYRAKATTFFDPSGKEPTIMQWYFGPNKYRLLQKENKLSRSDKDLELEELVYLGWPLFKYINRFFTIYVFDWLTQLGFSMGIVLLLITILLRIIVYPTTKKSYMSSAKMRVLKPKMDEITKKYPNPEDNMKKQQEIMSLYSKYGVSPMGGCLPMLLQMPIWIAMFNFVPNAIELRQESFLWASDLSTYDDLIHWETPIWLIGNHLSLFCLLFSITNIVYSWMSMKQQKDSMVGQQAEQMKVMQWMMYLMPVMFFFFFNDYSSGLNYYYFISLLSGALTMWYLRKTTDDKKLLAKLEENYQKNKDNPKKASGLAARLEALQKQQQAMLEEQRKKQGKQ